MIKFFNKNIQYEKVKRLVKSKLGVGGVIQVPKNTLYDTNGKMAIERIVLTEDNELTCFAPQQSSNYYADVISLEKKDFQAIIDFINNFFLIQTKI